MKRLLAVTRWPLFYKGFVGTLAIVFILLSLVTYIALRSLNNNLKTAIRQDLASRANYQMDALVNLIEERMAVVHTLVVDAAVVAQTDMANARYDGDALQELIELNDNWRRAADDDQLVQAVLNPKVNGLTAKLQAYGEGMPWIADLIVTDRYGALAAATYRPVDYVYVNQAWWQASYAEGAGRWHIAVLTNSQATEDYVLSISTPIYAQDDSDLVGIMRANFSLEPFQDAMDDLLFKDDLGAILLDADKRKLLHNQAELLGEVIPESWLSFDYQRRIHQWYETQFADGVPVLLAHQFISDATLSLEPYTEAVHNLDWLLFVYVRRRVAYRAVNTATVLSIMVALLLMGGGAWATRWVVRNLSVPVEQLLGVVEQEAAGDKNVRAWVYAPDESGDLAGHINRLIEEKQSLQQNVLQRADERAREQARRQREIETTAAVGAVTSATMDTNELIQQVVGLIRERFGLYFVAIYLVNEAHTRLVLHGGTGEAGQALLARGYRVSVGQGLVGQCLLQGTSYLDQNVDRSEDVDLPELPYARSELALPLRSRGEVLGVLSLHSYHTDTFDEDFIVVLQVIADQTAVAIDSIRLFDERQRAMRDLQRAYGEASREAWEALLQTRNMMGAGYQARVTGPVKLAPAQPEAWRSEAQQAWRERRVVTLETDEASGEQYVALPIVVRENVVGVIDVSKSHKAGPWTADEITQLEALIDQLGIALENARLYEDAQGRAIRQRLMSDVSSRIRSPFNVDAVLQTAAHEMRALLGLDEVEVRLGAAFAQPPDDASADGQEA